MCVLLLDVDTPDADGARDADAVAVVVAVLLLLVINRFVVIVAGEAVVVVVVNLEIVRCGYVGVFETIFLLGGSTFATGTSGLVNSIISLLA